MYRLFFALRITAFLLVSLSIYTPNLFAQAPVISYTTPHTYKVNASITPLVPTNIGGAVPFNAYGEVSTLTGLGGPGGLINGPVAIAKFNGTRDAAVDDQGNIYVVDDNNRIRKITPAGIVEPFAGSGAIGFVNGTGAAASFAYPTAITVDNNGNVYVCDNNNHAIRKITPAGVVTTVAGNGTIGFSDGLGAAAMFHTPCGITVDAAGNLYVADQFNNAIRKITPAGLVTTMAGNGSYGAINGTGSGATFSQPVDVAVDAAGNVFVADEGNSLIRKVTPNGVVTTVAGRGSSGFADGVTTSAVFSFPSGIVIDAAGNLYVADAVYNQRIRKITLDGMVTTLAGNGNIGFTNGIGTSATFSYPYGIGIDKNGNLYIADCANSAFRKIGITGYTIDKPLPAGLVFDAKTGTISGTPTALSPPTVYTITAYNGSGSSKTTVNIQVADIALLPSVITFPPPMVVYIDADNILHPDATSTNTDPETPITYTSSNPNVAYVGPDGQIHVIAPGLTTITAHQAGNENYSPAVPVAVPFNITQDQVITFPALAVKTTCSSDFPVGATSSNNTIPLTYVSSNTAVATVSATGNIHIVGLGSATITASQSGNNLYNAAVSKSQPLTVSPPVMPSVTISPPGVMAGCDGMEYTYTADAQNAGNNATYQWMLNGQNSGDHSKTFTSSTLQTGDIITCVVINNDECVPLTSPVSNQATIKNSAYTTLSLSISSSVSGTITSGTPVTFKAQPSNVQDNPTYQWYVNGQTVGTNSATFTSNTLADGDMVSCDMASGGMCIVNPLVNSNVITVAVIVPEKIIVPNTFTPNGDGHNDTWYIPGLLSYTNCIVNIYNRYGAIMYRSVGYQHPWDGTANGKTVPAGAYYYVIDTKSTSGKLSGEVTVLR
ncbi:gliding motility-associated C-terminal domain-containing protein [Mucilaginibacter rubeus]|uniref:T9SS type B sorting domain-containing protein n=1 Tax=Mucilaginibacter rubeus TaxID=2027860 RepID=A0A5C1I3V5_9SPHI|nr:gliding motility-associated C-terminal domain-containing protein [Mucilaginibacter rubeus]QEM12048.1 T9SS type B sorting domain-containing protein [Mucilaginibacter rubeus]